MPQKVTLEQARNFLKAIINHLSPGQEVIITEDQKPVAKLIGQPSSVPEPRRAGRCKGMITLAIEDEQHLDAF